MSVVLPSHLLPKDNTNGNLGFHLKWSKALEYFLVLSYFLNIWIKQLSIWTHNSILNLQSLLLLTICFTYIPIPIYQEMGSENTRLA